MAGESEQVWLVRCVHSGVFIALGVDRNGTEAVLQSSRMLFEWEGAAALSQVARDGIKSGRVCVPVACRTVLDVCELLPCTQRAAQNLLSQPEWVA